MRCSWIGMVQTPLRPGLPGVSAALRNCASSRRPAPESIASAAQRTPPAKSSARPAMIRAAAAFSKTTSRLGPGSPSRILSIRRRSPAHHTRPSALSGACASPASPASRVKLRTVCSRTSATSLTPFSVSSSRPSRPWTTNACLTPSRARVSATREPRPERRRRLPAPSLPQDW
jgi:hypothetical protein